MGVATTYIIAAAAVAACVGLGIAWDMRVPGDGPSASGYRLPRHAPLAAGILVGVAAAAAALLPSSSERVELWQETVDLPVPASDMVTPDMVRELSRNAVSRIGRPTSGSADIVVDGGDTWRATVHRRQVVYHSYLFDMPCRVDDADEVDITVPQDALVAFRRNSQDVTMTQRFDNAKPIEDGWKMDGDEYRRFISGGDGNTDPEREWMPKLPQANSEAANAE